MSLITRCTCAAYAGLFREEFYTYRPSTKIVDCTLRDGEKHPPPLPPVKLRHASERERDSPAPASIGLRTVKSAGVRRFQGMNDCLCAGGLMNKWQFPDDLVRDVYNANVAAGVDYMEIGCAGGRSKN